MSIRKFERLIGVGFDYYDGYEGTNIRGSWMAGRGRNTQTFQPEGGDIIGYYQYDLVNDKFKFVTTYMLEDYTDTDDQDWQDFLRLNK